MALEGAIVVTFFVAVQLLLNRHYFSLSAAEYGAVYLPVFAAAVLAALLAARGSRAAARGRVFRLGLTLTVAGRAAMIAAVVAAVRHAAVFFPDLVTIGALTGAGFALVYAAATAFELDIDPVRPERHLLRLTLTLSAGMATGPLLQMAVVETGLWWAFPLIAAGLAVLLITLSPRSRLGPDAGRSCALRNPARPVPVQIRVYIPVAFIAVAAVVICVTWAQAGMIRQVTGRTSTGVLGLGAFWAALAVLASVGFSAISMRASHRRPAILGLFLLPAAVAVTGLIAGRQGIAVVGIFLLAAVVSAALLPPLPYLTRQQLVVLPLVTSAGIIGIYPVAIGLARPTLVGFRSDGATLPVIFAATCAVAIAASVTCARLVAYRQAPPGPGSIPAQAPAPSLARSCTATGPPRRSDARTDGSQQDEKSNQRTLVCAPERT